MENWNLNLIRKEDKIMTSEIGPIIAGAITGLGGMVLILKFLNGKIDKQDVKIKDKQDKTLCILTVQTFSKAIDKSIVTNEEVMKILGQIQIATGKIEEQLKYFNGKV